MITFIFPIYNQEHVLKKSITHLDHHLSEYLEEKYEILICNDGSPDNCLQIANDLSEKLEHVQSIGYSKNKGRGHAIKYAGLLHAKGDYIIYMDCDLVEDKYLEYINTMIEKVKDYDVVVASRFLPTSNTIRKWQRKIVSKVYRILIAIIFSGFDVTDPDVGFKGYKKECFHKVNLVCNLNGPSWDLQFLVNAKNEGYQILEFPFNYIEDYERSTANIALDSFVEFLGLIYIKVTCIITRFINF